MNADSGSDGPEITAPGWAAAEARGSGAIPEQTPGSADTEALQLTRSAAIMSIGTILSRVTGVVRLAAIAAALGVAESKLADTYNLANTAPNIIYQLFLGGILTSVFVPVFVELLEREGRDEAWKVASALINLGVLFLAVLSVIGIIGAPWIARFYAGRLEGEQALLQQDVMTFLLRLTIPQIIFYGLAATVGGLLNAHKRFGPPMYTPILNNLLVIAVFVAFHAAYGPVGLDASGPQLWIIGLGTTAGVVAMAAAQLPFLKGLGRYRLTFSAGHPSVRKLARLSMYMIGYIAVGQVSYVIVQWLANKDQGGYSAYFNAYTFFIFPISLFVLSVTTALMPAMSGDAVHERWEAFTARFSTGVRSTLLLVLPSAVGYLVLGRPIVRLLLENGVMTSASTDLVSEVLAFLVLGLVQFAVFQLIARTFYALQDARTPFLVNCAVVAVNVAVNVPLFRWLGVNGLAIGHAVAYTTGMVVSAAALRKRIERLDGPRITRSAARIAGASIGMGAVAWTAWKLMEDFAARPGFVPQATGLMVPLGFAVAAYLGLAHVLGVEELDYVKRLLGRRLRPRSGP